MCNNLLVLEFTEIPCSDANLIDIPTVLQKLVFQVAGPVSVASAYSLRLVWKLCSSHMDTAAAWVAQSGNSCINNSCHWSPVSHKMYLAFRYVFPVGLIDI